MVAPDRIQTMNQIELFDIWTVWRQMTEVKSLLLQSNTLNHLTMNEKYRDTICI